jgi:2-keto-4-pentenoate hydratase/2-oxohepta-3-ene-1,7-dioic acid hydratase in catechol pathway
LTNNGETVQVSDSSYMLWKIDELISYVSQFFTLKIGDIIFTGTPAGVAAVKPTTYWRDFRGTKTI